MTNIKNKFLTVFLIISVIITAISLTTADFITAVQIHEAGSSFQDPHRHHNLGHEQIP